MQDADLVEDAFLYCEGGRIAAFGPMHEMPPDLAAQATERVDCTGRVVLPGYVDSHTHLVFAATREAEYVQRLQGATYEQIAAAGGGILNSARRTAAATENELLAGARQRLWEVIRLGTTAIEIKSGYGLSFDGELKLLRVAQQLKAESPIPVRVTYLAAHALPMEYRERRQDYIRLICHEWIPAVAAEKLADYVDVFCEHGFFTPDETVEILAAGATHGLAGRVHANELAYSGGVQAAVRAGACSADHLECVGPEELRALAGSAVVPTLLPGTAFFLGIAYAPARMMIDAGLGIALASDYNPGTCPTGNMNLVVATACAQMKMLPAEALCAATLNAAHALQWGSDMGSIAVGKVANFLVTNPLSSYTCIPYHFGHSTVQQVWVGGKRLV
jgi:imidazolonepropionase